MTEANPHAHDTDGPADEDAYRRGYQQGAEHALKAIAASMPVSLLQQWKDAIYRWRFQVTHKARHYAPRIDFNRRSVIEFDKKGR